MTISSRLLIADRFSKYIILTIKEYSEGKFEDITQLKDFVLNKNTTKDNVIGLLTTFQNVINNNSKFEKYQIDKDLKFVQSNIIN